MLASTRMLYAWRLSIHPDVKDLDIEMTGTAYNRTIVIALTGELG